ncbi:MAG: hypothetical protein IMZ53_09570 [Thermoplasmata archaeon]|nr:hypothetical protein [Thermoplasmata archaeon]MBE3140818.1 hypothetical protein [Thermoplasmata archaeon]
MKKISRYLLNVAIGFDQLGNTLWGGQPDETISSRIGRIKKANGGKIPWNRPVIRIIDAGLEKIDKGHSIDAIEVDELDQTHRESVIDGHIGTEEKK